MTTNTSDSTISDLIERDQAEKAQALEFIRECARAQARGETRTPKQADQLHRALRTLDLSASEFALMAQVQADLDEFAPFLETYDAKLEQINAASAKAMADVRHHDEQLRKARHAEVMARKAQVEHIAQKRLLNTFRQCNPRLFSTDLAAGVAHAKSSIRLDHVQRLSEERVSDGPSFAVPSAHPLREFGR